MSSKPVVSTTKSTGRSVCPVRYSSSSARASRRRLMRHIAVAFVLLSATPSLAADSFPALADEFWDAELAFDPGLATDKGVHRYDDRLQDLSQPSVQAWVDKLHAFDKRFAAVDARTLPAAEAIDLATVRQQIQSSLVFWTVTRDWRRRP